MAKTLEVFIEELKSVIDDIPKHLTETLERNADELIRETQERTPVDTGNLRDSWKRTEVVRNGDTYSTTIYNDATNPKYGMIYSSYVEYGHFSTAGNWVEGRFMLTQSLPNAQKRIEQDLRKDFEKVFSRFS